MHSIFDSESIKDDLKLNNSITSYDKINTKFKTASISKTKSPIKIRKEVNDIISSSPILSLYEAIYPIVHQAKQLALNCEDLLRSKSAEPINTKYKKPYQNIHKYKKYYLLKSRLILIKFLCFFI